MKKKLLCTLIALSAVIPAYSAPGFIGNDPGVINRQNIEQLKDLNIEKNVIQTTEEEIERQKKLEEKIDEKEIIKDGLTYNPQFLLKEIIFEGNTVISTKKLKKLTSKYEETEIYLEDLADLTLEISRYYQKKGYITSFAYLDAQEIIDGVVTIKIHESKVAKKEVYGNKWEKDRYLENFVLGGFGLNYNNVFNAKALQGAMGELNTSPYMQGTVALSRDEKKDTEIKLNVQDRFPISLDMSWDDFGRNYTGRQRFTTILGIDNLTGYGDRIYGGAILAQDSKGAIAGYEIPIGRWGTKLGFDYSHSRMDLGGPYRPYGIHGYANDYIIRLTQPIKRTASQEIYFTTAFDWLNSKTESTMYGSISDYSLRVLRSAVRGIFNDKYGRTLANIGVDIGFNGIGASGNIDNGPRSSFYKIIAGLARIQRLPKECLAIARINGQYSAQALYPMEQMFIGGAYSVRGYQPSELIGDYGVAGSFEVRTPIPGIKALFPKKYEDKLARKIKLALFYDWGYVKEHHGLYNYETNFIHSVGVGSHINFTDEIALQIGIGIPLSRKLNENSGRLYFSLSTELDKLFMKPIQRL